MSRVAAVVTLYGARGAANAPEVREALLAQTRRPDETWVLAEAMTPQERILGKWAGRTYHRIIDTPRNGNGQYAVIPYSLKSNYALERTKADYVTYVTDDSRPAPEKYERMAAALDEHAEWGAVYCSQDHGNAVRRADRVIPDAYCLVDHTQVMHRLTSDRWPLNVKDIMLGDALFWRSLHASLGPFYPVPAVLDHVRQTPDGISGGNRG